MKLSIVTVVLNNKVFLESCIGSVLEQDCPNVEYIIIDGGSTDGTLQVIKKYEKRINRWISEKDQGIYDAMNKGIRLATGDVIGILNSDDFYVSKDVLSTVKNEFESRNVDSVFADMVYVKRHEPEKIVRYYRSSGFTLEKFTYGCMPAHPTFFVKRDVYERFGLFKTDYHIASDYELMLRFLLCNRISYNYLPKVLIKMRAGGVSTRSLKSNWILNNEILRACSENGIKTNIFKVYSKYLTKCFQLIDRPNKI